MDIDMLDAFSRHLRYKQAVDYVNIAGCGVLIYDYILTVALEITLIWPAPWNYTKALFLLARYLPIINMYFSLSVQVSLDNTAGYCDWAYQLITWLVIFGMYFAEIILAVRTWAVWQQDRKVGLALVVLLAAAIVVECISVDRFLRTLEFADPPYYGFRGCNVVNGSSILFVAFIIVGLVEIIVLVLMSISAFRAYRLGNHSKLSNVIYRDGILFYVYLLCLALCNLVVMLVLSHDLRLLLAPLQGVFCAVFATRIVINIRTVGRPGAEDLISELHHSFHEEQQISIPLILRAADRLGGSGGVA